MHVAMRVASYVYKPSYISTVQLADPAHMHHDVKSNGGSV